MEGKDDRVTSLKSDKGFENRCRSWVSCWCHPTDNAYWLSNRNQTLFFIFSDNAYCPVIFNTIPNVFRSIHVFDGFIFINTTACFINSQFCQIHMFIKGSNRSLVNNVVHLLLRKVRHGIEGFNPFCCQFIYYCLNIFSLFSHMKLL